MIRLRDYQDDELLRPARVALRSSDSVCVVAPTGAGKTAVLAYMCQQATARGLKVLIITHKGIILRQIMRTLHDFGVERGHVISGRPVSMKSTMVAMVGTLIHRLDSVATPDIVIVDEFHHVMEGNTWGKVIRHYQSKNPKMKLIGLTATPQGRCDGKGLWPFAESIVQGPSLKGLISKGWLTYAKVFNASGGADFRMNGKDFDKKEQIDHFSKPKIIGGVIDHYRQHLDGLPTIVSCAGLEHADLIAKRYSEYARSVGLSWKCVMIQGGKKHEKQMIDALNGMATGSVQIVTFDSVISEGVDVKACMGLQMLRKTTSLVLFLQFIGRILRPVFSYGFDQYNSTAEERLEDIAKGIKPYAVLLDHVNNTGQGLHGYPFHERIWGLSDTATGRKVGSNTELLTTECTACLAVWPGKPTVCENCGADLVAQALKKAGKKTPEEIAGELKEYAPEMLGKVIAMQNMLPNDKRKAMMKQIFAEGDIERNRVAAKALGYKKGFTRMVWNLKKNK